MSLNFVGEKGQLLSFDLIVAALIFLLILASVFGVYWTQKAQLQEQLSLQDMHLSAINATNFILSDQNCYNGGLVNEKYSLSQEKISCFNSMDYNALKQRLSLDQYEFTIKISDSNSIRLQKGFTTTNRAVSIQRVVEFLGRAEKVVFVVYEK